MSFEGARQLLLDFSSLVRGAVSPDSDGTSPSKCPSTVRSRHPAETEKGLHERRIAACLSVGMTETVDVLLTDNRRTLISSSRKNGVRIVRLHRMFSQADDLVIRAIGVFLMGTGSRAASAQIDAFIDAHRGDIRPLNRPLHRRTTTPAGRYFNLAEVLVRVSERYFGSLTGVTIGWGRERKRSHRRRSGRISRALATYCYEDASIRVNPVLDSSRVPSHMIEWVVYHELLHHVLPVHRTEGRSRYHTSEFRAMERAFAEYDKAREWERANLDWLIR